MRCARCGNNNPEPNRFCGMCGATLLAPAPLRVDSGPRDTPRPATGHDEPSISGPSFLGLNAPARHASANADPAAPSASVDYLLEDEETPRHWGMGKVLLILLAFALAVGFGYLRWKNHGLTALSPAASRASTAAKNSGSTDADSTSAPSVTDSQTAPNSTPAAAKPDVDSSAGANAPGYSPNTLPSTANDSAKTIDGTAYPPAEKGTRPAPTPTSATRETPPADTAAAKDAPAEAPEPATKPSTVPKQPAPKPAPPADPVAQAQKYLYGRGAPQDCERGLRLLKPAAEASNPKAMIEMGALYSAGLCTPHDLPTAYRWFAKALHNDPNNVSVQTDLQKLWGEMTQPERQLAIKLSQ